MTSTDKEFLQNFDVLKTQQNKDLVLAASNKIIKTILAQDHLQNKEKPEAGNNLEQLGSRFGKNLSQDLRYALKRLSNGLISTNPVAQLNYSFCLTQIFKSHKQSLDIKEIIEMFNEKSNKKQAINKTEVNMFAIGRVYAVKSIAQSQIIESQSDCEQILEQVFEHLFQDFQTFDFLQESILDVFRIFLQSNTSFKLKIKLMINKGKFLLKEHNAVSLQYLAICQAAAEKEKITFSYEQNLQEKVFNHKNLIKTLLNEVQYFPRKSAAYPLIISYIRSATQKTEKKAKQIWEDFFKVLLKDLGAHDHKHIFVLLHLFYQFLKQAEIQDLAFILNNELIHIWLRNLAVMNHNLKKISSKIENKVVKLINRETSRNKSSKELPENQQKLIYNFLTILKSDSTSQFTVKSRLAQSILHSISEEKRTEYYKFLKKQLHKAVDPLERKFYLNEIYVLGELMYGQINESIFLEICFLIFEQANQSKLRLVFSKIPEDIKEDYEELTFVSSNRELILGYFYSLLSTALKQPSQNYKDKKAIIWRGLDNNGDSMLLTIMQDIIQKEDHFQDNSELMKTLEVLKPFVKEALKQQKEIQKMLKSYKKSGKDQTEEEEEQNKKLKLKQLDEEKGFSLKMQISFLNLFVGVIIQTAINQEEETEQLEEIQILHSEIVKFFETQETQEKPKKKKKLSNASNADVEEEPTFVNVLTDLLIAQLTRSATFLREVINQCFGNFVGQVDSMCLDTLTNVVCRPNDDYINEMEGEGEQGLENNDDSEEEEKEQKEAIEQE